VPQPYVANSGNETDPLAIDSKETIYFHTGSSFVPVNERLSAINPDGTQKWQVTGNFRGNTNVVLTADESTAYLLQIKYLIGMVLAMYSRFSTVNGQRPP